MYRVEAGFMFENGGHIRCGMMGFQMRRLVDNARKRGGVRAAKTVADELAHEVKRGLRQSRGDRMPCSAMCLNGSRDELSPYRCFRSLDAGRAKARPLWARGPFYKSGRWLEVPRLVGM